MSAQEDQQLPANYFRLKYREWTFHAVVTIENVLSYQQSTEVKYCTPPFTSSPRGSGIYWAIVICPKNHNRLLNIVLRLKSIPGEEDHLFANWEFSIISEDGLPRETTSGGNAIQLRYHHGIQLFSIDHQSLINRKLLSSGHLTFECKIKTSYPLKTHRVNSDYGLESAKNPFAADILGTLLAEQLNHDVVLKTGQKEFKCHKNVLSAASPFFKALFAHDTKENLSNEVDLTETMDEVEMKDFVDFIYLGAVGNLGETCFKLYEVAEMYGGLEELKELCVNEMLGKIKPQAAVEILLFAEKHGIVALKKSAAKCIYDY